MTRVLTQGTRSPGTSPSRGRTPGLGFPPLLGDPGVHILAEPAEPGGHPAQSRRPGAWPPPSFPPTPEGEQPGGVPALRRPLPDRSSLRWVSIPPSPLQAIQGRKESAGRKVSRARGPGGVSAGCVPLGVPEAQSAWQHLLGGGCQTRVPPPSGKRWGGAGLGQGSVHGPVGEGTKPGVCPRWTRGTARQRCC